MYNPFVRLVANGLLLHLLRYAGLLWTNPDKFDKLDAKGLETVRRDNCLLGKLPFLPPPHISHTQHNLLLV
ncbi:hypothetical protein EON63_05400 [archaeon]|nr:MAG: hypothetical protein EON63_05400 [archaeon]